MSFKDFQSLLHEIINRAEQLKQTPVQMLKKESSVSDEPVLKDDFQNLTKQFTSIIQKLKCTHLILVIDEVDAFSHHKDAQKPLIDFIKAILQQSLIPNTGITIVGIANSIELFKGEHTSKNQVFNSTLLCKREEKIIFTPYTKQQVSSILFTAAQNHINQNFPADKSQALCSELLTQQAVNFVAMKVDKLSGDLRMAFNMLRKTIEKKLIQIKQDPHKLPLTYEDANNVVTEMYQSKTASIIKHVPRSHIILLLLIEEMFKAQDINMIEFDLLFREYNKESISMMIQRISVKEFEQILETLIGSSILSKKVLKQKKYVKLEVELEELTEALAQTRESQERAQSKSEEQV